MLVLAVTTNIEDKVRLCDSESDKDTCDSESERDTCILYNKAQVQWTLVYCTTELKFSKNSVKETLPLYQVV